MAKKQQTLHHIIPSSREKDGFRVSIHDNYIYLPEHAHRGLHLQYMNKTPQEQLHEWVKVNLSVLSNEVRNAIFELIELPRDKFYQLRFIKHEEKK